MDKHVLETPTVPKDHVFWCPSCQKETPAEKKDAFSTKKCGGCGGPLRFTTRKTYAPVVFLNISPAQQKIEILDTEFEMMLPDKNGRLEFHFSLARHYYPMLDSPGKQKNSIICHNITLNEIRADLHHFGNCLPDIDLTKHTSFLLKAKSGRVYKFDHFEKQAKHCFVIGGPGVETDMSPEVCNLLACIRRIEDGDSSEVAAANSWMN